MIIFQRTTYDCLFRTGLSAFAFCFAVSSLGCGPRPGAFSRQRSASALSAMAQSSNSVQSVSARCRLILERPADPSGLGRTARGERSVELTAVIVSEPPFRHRLRAWKLSRPILDFTLTPNGTWVWHTSRSDESGEMTTFLESIHYEMLPRALNLAFGYVDRDFWKEVPGESNPAKLVMSDRIRGHGPAESGSAGGDTMLRCEVTESSTTLFFIQLANGREIPRFKLEMDRYRQIESAVIPTRLRGTTIETGSRQTDSAIEYRFTLLLQSIDVNEDLPEEAFRPPSKARYSVNPGPEWLPPLAMPDLGGR